MSQIQTVSTGVNAMPLEFPGLGISVEVNRVAFTVFGHSIFWYGIIAGLAFAVATTFYLRRGAAFGLNPDRVIDAVIGAVVCGVIGARIYYVAFRWEAYRYNLASIINLREGGLAFYGGVIGGIVGALLVARWRGIRRLPLLDLLASGLLIGLSIGRWGNFVNIEAFGSNTTAPWGMISPVTTNFLYAQQETLAALGVSVDPHLPVHPTFFYEFLWGVLGFLLISLYIKRRKFDGEITLIFFGWYGLGRAVIEGLRVDSLTFGGFRVSQVLAVVFATVSIIMLATAHVKKNPRYYKLYTDIVGLDSPPAPVKGRGVVEDEGGESKDENDPGGDG